MPTCKWPSRQTHWNPPTVFSHRCWQLCRSRRHSSKSKHTSKILQQNKQIRSCRKAFTDQDARRRRSLSMCQLGRGSLLIHCNRLQLAFRTFTRKYLVFFLGDFLHLYTHTHTHSGHDTCQLTATSLSCQVFTHSVIPLTEYQPVMSPKLHSRRRCKISPSDREVERSSARAVRPMSLSGMSLPLGGFTGARFAYPCEHMHILTKCSHAFTLSCHGWAHI